MQFSGSTTTDDRPWCDLTIAHAAIATPRRSGLYETVRELVAAERALGCDARIVDPKPHATLGPAGPSDRGALLADMDWATSADVVVSHSGHAGTPVAKTDQPIIIAVHGRPESTWAIEAEGGVPALTYHVTRPRGDRYRAGVTFWSQYEPILRPWWAPKLVHVIPAPVDLEYWCPGESSYDFHGTRGDINVVMADPWARRDMRVLPMLAAFNLFRKIVPGARLHIFASSSKVPAAVREMLGDSLGVVAGWVPDLRPVYRAADLVISPHPIATRSLRESMACGTQVVSGADVDPGDVETFALEMARRISDPIPVRRLAEAMFDPAETARGMLRVAYSARGVAA